MGHKLKVCGTRERHYNWVVSLKIAVTVRPSSCLTYNRQPFYICWLGAERTPREALISSSRKATLTFGARVSRSPTSASWEYAQSKATVSLLSAPVSSISPNFANPAAIAAMRRAAPLPSPSAATEYTPSPVELTVIVSRDFLSSVCRGAVQCGFPVQLARF